MFRRAGNFHDIKCVDRRGALKGGTSCLCLGVEELDIFVDYLDMFMITLLKRCRSGVGHSRWDRRSEYGALQWCFSNI